MRAVGQPSIPACRPTPAHTLGPHVVGQRVVVRRVLPGETGPSGGPAMTDVLGTCTSWGDGVCVIEPDGEGRREPVTIRLPDIVSGKPVPPRPSTRHRVSPAEAQRRALALWPDLETEPLGDWLLRRSRTSTARRANSVLAMGPSGVEDGYERVVAHYEALGQRPIAAVLPDSGEDALFRGHGWVLESHDHDTVFKLAGVAAARRSLAGVSLPGLDVAIVGDDRLVTAEATTGRRPAARQRRRGVRRRLGRVPHHRGGPGRARTQARAAGHGRAARVGRRARRDHGVPPGARRQRPRASRSTTGSASPCITGIATSRRRKPSVPEISRPDGRRSARRPVTAATTAASRPAAASRRRSSRRCWRRAGPASRGSRRCSERGQAEREVACRGDRGHADEDAHHRRRSSRWRARGPRPPRRGAPR